MDTTKTREKLRFLVSLFQAEETRKIPSACASVCRRLVQSPEWKEWSTDLLLWWPHKLDWNTAPYADSFPRAFLYIMENSLQPHQIFDALLASPTGLVGLAWIIIYSLNCHSRDRHAMEIFWSMCTHKETENCQQNDGCFFLRLVSSTTKFGKTLQSRGELSAKDSDLLQSTLLRWKYQCQQELFDVHRPVLRSQSAWLSWIQEQEDNEIRRISDVHSHLGDGWCVHYLCDLIERESAWQQWLLSFSLPLQLGCLSVLPLSPRLAHDVLQRVFQQSNANELDNLVQTHPSVFRGFIESLSWQSLCQHAAQGGQTFLSTLVPSPSDTNNGDILSTLANLTRLLETEHGLIQFSCVYGEITRSEETISLSPPENSGSKVLQLTTEELGALWIYLREHIGPNCPLTSFLFAKKNPTPAQLAQTEQRLRNHLDQLLHVEIPSMRKDTSPFYLLVIQALARAWKTLLRMDDNPLADSVSCSIMTLALHCVLAVVSLYRSLERNRQQECGISVFDTVDCFACVFLMMADDVQPDELYTALLLVGEVMTSLVALDDPRASEQSGYLKRTAILACLVLQALPGDEPSRKITFDGSSPNEETIDYPIHLNRTEPWEETAKDRFFESLGAGVWGVLGGIVSATCFREEIMNIISEKLEAFESYKTPLFSAFHPSILCQSYEGQRHLTNMPREYQSLHEFVTLLLRKMDEILHVESRTPLHTVLCKRLLRLLGELAYLEAPVYVFLSVDPFARLLGALGRGNEEGVRENAAIDVSVILSALMADPLPPHTSEGTEEDWKKLRQVVVRRILTVCMDQHLVAKLINQGLNQRCGNSVRLNAHCLEALHALSSPVPTSCQEQQLLILTGLADESLGLVPAFRGGSFSYKTLFEPDAEPARYFLSLLASLMDRNLLTAPVIVETLDRVLQVDEQALFPSLLEVLALIQKCVEQKNYLALLKRKNLHRVLFGLTQRIPAELTVQRDHCLRLGRKIGSL